MPQVGENTESRCDEWRRWTRIGLAQGRGATRLRYAPTLNALILNHLYSLDPTHLLSLSQNHEIQPTVPKRGWLPVRGLNRAHRQVAVLGNRVRAAALDARSV